MKNKKYAQRICLSLIAFGAVIFSGCASQPSVRPDTGTSISGPMGSNAFTAISRAAQLQIGVDALALDPKDRNLASAIRSQIAGRLNQQGLEVSPQGGDLSVGVTVTSAQFDKSGNYYRFEGTADTLIRRNVDFSTVNSKAINVRADRKLGEASARDALAAELSRETAEWVGSNLSNQSLHLSANDIEVKMSLFTQSQNYSATFIDRVGAIDGVASVILIDQNSAAKTLTFRVVYFQRKLPGGILHRIARIDELNIKP